MTDLPLLYFGMFCFGMTVLGVVLTEKCLIATRASVLEK